MADPKYLAALLKSDDANVWNQFVVTAPIVGKVRLDLSDADLRGTWLAVHHFRANDLRRADLSEAEASGAIFDFSHLADAVAEGADFTRASFQNAGLESLRGAGSCFDGANLTNARLNRSDLRGAQFTNANLTDAVLDGADLRGADLTGAILVRTSLKGTQLDDAKIHGISAWNIVVDGHTTQKRLVISQADEPTLMVDDLEVAQFVYLLLNRKKLRDVVNAVTEKGVLILGRFGDGGLGLLRGLGDALRGRGYLPIIFDFERPTDRDLTETIRTLVGLSRFVVVDLSGPSVPHESLAVVPDFEVPFVPVLQEGQESWAMSSDLGKYSWWLQPVVRFTDAPDLNRRLDSDIVLRAESKFQELRIAKARRLASQP